MASDDEKLAREIAERVCEDEWYRQRGLREGELKGVRRVQSMMKDGVHWWKTLEIDVDELVRELEAGDETS